MSQENTFQLHYFPEIPLERTGSCRTPREDFSHFNGRDFVRDGGGGAWSLLPQEEKATPSALCGKSLDEIETQAFLRGFNKGEKAGLGSAADRIESFKRLLEDTVAGLRRVRKKIQEEAEKEIVELALAVAGRIVGHEIQTNRQSVVAVVREALQRVENRETVVVKMNPADIEFLDRLGLPLASLLRNPDGMRFEGDDCIGIGGCLIETDGGDVDARLESKLGVIEEAFRKYFSRSSTESDTATTNGRLKA